MALAFETSQDPVHPYKSSLSWVRFPRGGARGEDSCKGGFEEKPIKGQRGWGPRLRGAREGVVFSQAPWKDVVEPALEPLRLRGVRYQEGDLGAFYSCTHESLV